MPCCRLKSRSRVTRVWNTKLSLFVFLFLVSPLFCCNLRTLPGSFFFFAHSISFQAHWLYQPTSPSLIGLLVMCLRQMEVDGPVEGCVCACVTGINFVCVYEYVYGSQYVCLRKCISTVCIWLWTCTLQQCVGSLVSCLIGRFVKHVLEWLCVCVCARAYFFVVFCTFMFIF